MSVKDVVFALVVILHDLFTVMWIGGLFTLTLSVLHRPKLSWELATNPNAHAGYSESLEPPGVCEHRWADCDRIIAG